MDKNFESPEVQVQHLFEAYKAHRVKILCEALGEEKRADIESYLSVNLDNDIIEAYKAAPNLMQAIVDFIHLAPLFDEPQANDEEFTQLLVKSMKGPLQHAFEKMLDPKNSSLDLFRLALQDQRTVALLNQHFRQQDLRGPIHKSLIDSIGYVLKKFGIGAPAFIDKEYDWEKQIATTMEFQQDLAILADLIQKTIGEMKQEGRGKDLREGADRKFAGKRSARQLDATAKKLSDAIASFGQPNKFLELPKGKIVPELAGLLLKFPNFAGLSEKLFDLDGGKVPVSV